MLAVFDTAKTHASDSAVNCQSTDVNKQQTCFKKKIEDLPFQICKIDSLIVYSSANDFLFIPIIKSVSFNFDL